MAQAAGRILDHVERRFQPNSAIRQLIGRIRDRGCAPVAPIPPWRLQAGLRTGHDSNPNLGLGADRLTLQIGGIATPVELATASRPRPSAWQGADLQGDIALDDHWRLHGAVSNTHYQAGADLEQNRLLLAASHTDKDSQTLLWLSRHTLGGQPYQDAAGLRHRRRLSPDGWEADLILQQSRYPGRATLDGWLLEPRLGYRLPLPGAGQILIGAGLQADIPATSRPGGRRTGPVAQAELLWPLPHDWRLEASARFQHLDDSSPYNPLFGNAQRRQDLAFGWLALTRTLAPRTRCGATLQALSSRDQIPLYHYTQEIVSLSCQHDF